MSENIQITRVRDVMSTTISTIDGMATVQDAIEIMKKTSASSIVVQRRDEDDEFGLVVVSDIAKKVIAENRSTARVNVYEVMTKPVLSVHVDMNIIYAIRMLVSFGVSRALVVDSDRMPIGLISLRDMVFRATR